MTDISVKVRESARLVPLAGKDRRDKIKTIDELAAIAQQARAAGKTVVHAHGVFDLLHPGHVRHLEAARALGDILIVTVTADRFVNKGPGRPAFSAPLRAEMLQALACVDLVAINEEPDAVGLLNRVRPSVYVKGQDYRNSESDVTGKIDLEQSAVQSHGGALKFTDEITFSSSELINRHLGAFEPEGQRFLALLRDDGAACRTVALIEKMRGYHVLVVGDAVVDEVRHVPLTAKTSAVRGRRLREKAATMMKPKQL